MAAAARGGTPRVLKLLDPLLTVLLLLLTFPCAAGGKTGRGYCPPTAPLLLLLLWLPLAVNEANGLTKPPAAESADAADLAVVVVSFPASSTPGAELRRGFCLAGGTAKGLYGFDC
jgi:hypothetical protein